MPPVTFHFNRLYMAEVATLIFPSILLNNKTTWPILKYLNIWERKTSYLASTLPWVLLIFTLQITRDLMQWILAILALQLPNLMLISTWLMYQQILKQILMWSNIQSSQALMNKRIKTSSYNMDITVWTVLFISCNSTVHNRQKQLRQSTRPILWLFSWIQTDAITKILP